VIGVRQGVVAWDADYMWDVWLFGLCSKVLIGEISLFWVSSTWWFDWDLDAELVRDDLRVVVERFSDIILLPGSHQEYLTLLLDVVSIIQQCIAIDWNDERFLRWNAYWSYSYGLIPMCPYYERGMLTWYIHVYIDLVSGQWLGNEGWRWWSLRVSINSTQFNEGLGLLNVSI
jgi:hypothetical protein